MRTKKTLPALLALVVAALLVPALAAAATKVRTLSSGDATLVGKVHCSSSCAIAAP